MNRILPVLALLLCSSAFAQTAIPTAPAVDARAYIVVDAHTDKVLASKDAVMRAEPASLTKLMTAYIVFQELAAGKLKLDEQVTVSEHAWREGGAASGGSATFLEVGKAVPANILILGMIVQSGNDATIALAERIAGTEETFAQMMNSNAQRLKMVGTHFDNSTGLPSPQHYTTARDMSLLATAIVREFPQYYRWYSVREFEYNGIKQQNRNGLLTRDPSVDGMKTGHTESAGYCLVTSAMRDGMRLVSVVLGSKSMKAREDASAALLNYGFTFFDTKLIAKAGTKLGSINVWKAQESPADVGIRRDLYVTVPRGEMGALKTVLELQPQLIAPLRTDSTVGSYKVLAGNGKPLVVEPLRPLKPVSLGGWWRRMVDTIKLWFA
jgi:serine-type D-Ala-D-Ala carboxypeptidase (penicillin-binding protein 5/6)